MRLVARTDRPSASTRPPPPPLTVAARIAQIEDTIQHLKLLAIATSVAGRAFSAAELLAHAELDADLRCVLEGATTPKQVGRRLRALADRTRGGLRLVCLGRENRGCIWSLQIHAEAGVSIDEGA
jgi:hypothetical protein